jgi:mono/diheme cytochrome c family protein
VSRTSIILTSGVCSLMVALAGGLGILPFAKAQETSQATTGWFQQAQAEQGHQLFNNYCAQCHRPDLSGAIGPALKGAAFLNKWTGQPLSVLYNFEHTKMPLNAPDSLPDATLFPITAYILQQNSYAAGSAPLDQAALAQTLPKP